MAATETAGESAMFERTIQMVMSVVAAGIMAHPLSIGMHVGSFGMSAPVVEVAVFLGRTLSCCSRRAMLRNVLMAATDLRSATALSTTALMAALLCHG